MKDMFTEGSPRNRKRLLERLDHMMAIGQVTQAEAQRLRAANGPEEFEAAVVEIRVRHATTKLDAAVANGQMSQTEADNNAERIRHGEHPRALRSHLRGVVPGGR
jgi:hypothetical protein